MLDPITPVPIHPTRVRPGSTLIVLLIERLVPFLGFLKVRISWTGH